MSTTVIALLQKKGGATKTTTTMNLAGALMELGYSIQIGDLNIAQRSAEKWANRGETFKDKVVLIDDKAVKKGIEAMKSTNVDFALLDLPPDLTVKALKAALLADFNLIPCQASVLDLDSLEETIEFIEDINKPYVLFASNIKKNTIVGQELPDILKKMGSVFETKIHSKISIVESAMIGEWVGTYKPKSEEHLEYLALAQEVITKAKRK